MRVLVLSDIHSSLRNLGKIISAVDFDLLLVAGDITNFKSEDVLKADEIISRFTDACYAVHGNCDYEEVLNFDLDAIEFVHARSVRLDDFVLHGIGGSNITPFGTPSEYTEEEMEKFFSKLEFSERNILLSHCPPKGVLDLTSSGVHAGCEVVRKYADRFDAILCGHIHESPGVFEGNFVAVNPGPAFSSRFAIFDTESFEVKLGRL